MKPGTSLIDVVLIPLDGSNVLLPNVCVAEILPGRRLAADDAAPPWQLGTLRWREREIVVVSLEALRDSQASGPSDTQRPTCVVVMNRLREAGEIEFYGIAAAGLPRLLHVADEDLESTGSGEGVEMLEVRLGTERAWVPDLEWVEQQIGASVPAG